MSVTGKAGEAAVAYMFIPAASHGAHRPRDPGGPRLVGVSLTTRWGCLGRYEERE